MIQTKLNFELSGISKREKIKLIILKKNSQSSSTNNIYKLIIINAFNLIIIVFNYI